MNTRERVQDLISYVTQGRIIEAMEEFYADGVAMQENTHEATVGKAANTERERAFVASIAEVHENRAALTVVDGDNSVINWVLDFTSTQGQRLHMDQLAVQTWQNGKIVHERFVYDTASLVSPAGA